MTGKVHDGLSIRPELGETAESYNGGLRSCDRYKIPKRKKNSTKTKAAVAITKAASTMMTLSPAPPTNMLTMFKLNDTLGCYSNSENIIGCDPGHHN